LTILGAVLVGGKSQRFGSNKADAQLAGVSLLTHQLNSLRSVPVHRLAYVGGEPRNEIPLTIDYVNDGLVGVDISERSSLLGILAALTFARDMECDSAIILGCDVPFIMNDSLRQLVAALRNGSSSCDIAVASSSTERDHWSIMAAHTFALTPLREAYMQGERAVHRAVASLQVARVVVSEVETVNINDQTTLANITADLRAAR
jgi:molybdopterin-guanine dinucleotide biosynthesis protein A